MEEFKAEETRVVPIFKYRVFISRLKKKNLLKLEKSVLELFLEGG